MKKPKALQARQGDVLLEKVPEREIPQGATRIQPQDGILILRRGEATGHHHSVDCRRAELYTLSDGSMLLKVNKETTLKHQEHSPITLTLGVWVIPQEQVEYTPQEIRHVTD